MAIIWEGNKKEFGTQHQSPPVPQNAVKIRDAEGFIGKSLPLGIVPITLCMVAMVLKAFINREPPISPVFLIPAFLIGFMMALHFLSWRNLKFLVKRPKPCYDLLSKIR